ncbi:hypothetical protein BV898_16095 [Hypsibius exemplaris]|uniref:Major facilitator superfamily associated domain-containing protein n=1 Tax=Hypsibius exemplaris TaxID=2072580 RepID=A0A9X6RL91_HYPEX|nr:hypothetical protein BV898_16095 [Hypsibius exemplaris]
MVRAVVDKPWTDMALPDKRRINWKLFPLKLLMLLVYGAMGALYPFLTLHMRTIGLSWTEIAVISAVVPFVSCIGPPLGGALADKIGNYRVTFIGFNVCSIAVHLLMLLTVPSLTIERRITHLDATLSCGHQSNGTFAVTATAFSGDNCSITDPSIQWTHNQAQELTFLHCHLKSDNEGEILEAPDDFHVCMSHHDSVATCYSLPNMKGRVFANTFIKPRNAVHGWTLVSYENGEKKVLVNSTVCSSSSLGNRLDGFSVECEIQTDFQSSCAKVEAADNRMKTVVIYSMFRFMAGIAVSTVVPILDAAAYRMSADYDGDLGIQRIFSLIGVSVFPPLSSFLVGLASKRHGFSDYSPAFYIFAVMNALAVFIAFFTQLSLQKAQEDIWRNVGRILRNPKVFTFVTMMFFAGIAWGFLENYLFLFMDGIGSPKWLLGMTNLVSSLAAIPVVALSTCIMRFFGHTKILMICLMIYGVRFFCYSLIYNPFMVLPVEALEAFTTSLLWVVASVYCGKIAPDYLATLQGVIGCVHHAMGRGVGSLLGGLMFDRLKPRLTYQIFAGVSAGVGILYMILHYAWLRGIPNPQKDDPGVLTGGSLKSKTSHQLSEEDANFLEKFAQMEAFSHQYSLSPQLSGEPDVDGGDDETESFHDTLRPRTRSRLAPSLSTVAIHAHFDGYIGWHKPVAALTYGSYAQSVTNSKVTVNAVNSRHGIQLVDRIANEERITTPKQVNSLVWFKLLVVAGSPMGFTSHTIATAAFTLQFIQMGITLTVLHFLVRSSDGASLASTLYAAIFTAADSTI